MNGVNKGFMVMMPQDKPIEEEDEFLVDNQIKFTILNKEFSFSIQVKTIQE